MTARLPARALEMQQVTSRVASPGRAAHGRRLRPTDDIALHSPARLPVYRLPLYRLRLVPHLPYRTGRIVLGLLRPDSKGHWPARALNGLVRAGAARLSPLGLGDLGHGSAGAVTRAREAPPRRRGNVVGTRRRALCTS